MKKQPLPSPTPTPHFLGAVKENLDQIMGFKREGPLPKLPDTATLSEVIAAYNALLERIQE